MHRGERGSVLLNAWFLEFDLFQSMGLDAVSLAAQGRRPRHLYLYEPADPVSAAWAKANIERRGGNPVSMMETIRLAGLQRDHASGEWSAGVTSAPALIH
jgi:hypothetical protein